MSGWEEWLKDQAGVMKGIWCDTYKLYLKYHGRRLTDAEWDALVDEINLIPKKYSSHEQTARRIVLCVLEQIEEENG